MIEEKLQNDALPVKGPGKLLQDAREEKNLRPEDVAYELRLTPSQVLALEENDYSKMPEETYVRGYIRNYARLVGVPENDILMSFARHSRGREIKSQAVLPANENELDNSSNKIRLLSVGIGIAVILFISVWLLISQDSNISEENNSETLIVEEKPVTTDIPVGESTLSLKAPAEKTSIDADNSKAVETMAPATDNSTDSAPANTLARQEDKKNSASSTRHSASASPEAAPEQIQSEELKSQQLTTVAPPLTPPAGANEGTLFISYSKDSWTDVRDANGKKLLYRTVKKGEKVAVAGKVPITLFFGFAQGVNVTFNGADIDMAAHTRGVFARFTVGEPANP